jgi:hypothetical protein
VDDSIDAVVADDALHQCPVADVAADESRLLADLGANAGRQIVKHDDLFTTIQQGINGVAADIAGTAGDKVTMDELRIAPVRRSGAAS